MTLPAPGGTQISRKDSIFNRLFRRFALQPAAPERRVPGGLDTVIRPVTNVDDLLRTPIMLDGPYDISAASWVTIYTPAKGKRARLIQLLKGASVGSAYFRLWYSDTAPRGFTQITLGATAGAVTNFPVPLPIPFLWELQAISGNVADTAVVISYLVEEEDDYV